MANGLRKEGRKASLEPLENRELLTATGWGDANLSAAEVAGAVESNAAMVGSVLNTTGNTIVVNMVKDVVDANDGKTSLREAISSARDGDVITFDSSISGKTIKVDTFIRITKSITIDGGDASNCVTLQGAGERRIFVNGGENSSPTTVLRDIKLTGGYAAENGGAILNNATLTIENAQFFDNTAGHNGGAIENCGTLTITNSDFYRNSCGQRGGAIQNNGGTMTLKNTVVYNNTAGNGGGIDVYVQTDVVNVYNSTIAGNKATHNGGGICRSDGKVSLYNTVVSKNHVSDAGGASNIYGVLTANVNCYTGDQPNFIEPPRFENGTLTNASAINLHLREASPLINAGNNSYVVSDKDHDGKNRKYAVTVDIGAYEYSSPVPISSVTISGTQGVENTLTANAFPSGCSASYQWYYSSTYSGTQTAISGATSRTYKIDGAYAGKYITVKATGTGEWKGTVSATSSTSVAYHTLSTPKVTHKETTSSITLTWEKVECATSYTVQWKENSSSSWTTVDNIRENTYAIQNLKPDTTYNVKVTACSNKAGHKNSSTASFNVVTSNLTKLSTPTVTVMSTTANSISVSWNAVSKASGYRVEWKRSDASSWSSISTTGVTYTVNGLSSATSYDVRVKACGDNITYSDSDYAPKTGIKTTDVVKLATPVVNASVVDKSSVTLNWNSISKAYGYYVYCKKSADSTYAYKGTVSGTSYKVSGLEANTYYDFYVMAYPNDPDYTNSDPGYRKNVKTDPNITPLPTPSDLSVSNITATRATVNWNSVANASGYCVTVSDANGSSETVELYDTSYRFTDLTKLTNYTVSVKAIGDGQTYGDSAEMVDTFTTIDQKKLSKPNVVVDDADSSSITLSWKAISRATKYEVRYKLSGASSYTIWGKTADCGCTISNLKSGKDYVVQARAIPTDPDYKNSDWTSVSVETPSPVLSLVVDTRLDVVNPNDGVTSLREAVAAANDGATITFAESLGETTIALDSKVKIEKSITIDGGNRVTLDGISDGCFRVSGENGNSVVEIRNLTFVNGDADGHGGAISNDYGTLMITNSTFCDNYATGFGGAIDNYYGNLTIVNSTFSGNSAYDCGGAIYTKGGIVLIANSSFSDNSSIDNGGAIYNDDGELTISNTTFSGNSSLSNGGAIYNYRFENNYETVISNSVFSGNSAKMDGGAIGNNWGYMTIANSSFSGNHANGGGSIDVYGGYVSVSDSLISGNTANYGGAIHCENSESFMVFSNCTIAGNSVGYEGGAIYRKDGTIHIYNTIVSQNYAPKDANISGGISANASNCVGVDPCFIVPPAFDSSGNLTNASSMNLRLRSNSIAIDSGDNDYVEVGEVDLDGNARIIGESVDIGAYEALPNAVESVSISGTVKVDSKLTAAVSPSDSSVNYQWYYSDTANGTLTAISGATSKTYTVAGKYVDKYITVKATGTNGWSGTVSATTKTAVAANKLSKPSVKVGGVTASTITVSWNAVSKAAKYQIQYKKSSSSTYTTKTITATNYTFTDLAPLTSYNIRVKAIPSAAGYTNSDYAAVSASTPSDVEKLSAPTDLTISAIKATKGTLRWTPVDNASGYRVSYVQDGASKTFYVNQSDSPSYAVSGLTKLTDYSVSVAALGDGQNYLDSDPSSVAFATVDQLKLGKPNLDVDDVAGSTIAVSWKKVSNADRYYVQYKASGDSSYTTWGYTKNLSVTLKDLTPSTLYTIRVRSVPTNGNPDYKNSDYSSISVKTTNDEDPKPLSAPEDLTVSSITATKGTLSWSPVDNAVGYRVSYVQSGASITVDVVDTSYRITGLTKLTDYSVSVVALGAGNYLDSDSSSITLTTVDQQKLPKPSVTATAGDTSISLKWKAVSNASKYYVVYKESTASSYTPFGYTTNLSCAIGNLKPSTEYTVRVRAVPGDTSDYKTSDYQTKTVSTLGETAQLAVPTNLTVSSITATKAKLSWSAVANATGYNVVVTDVATGAVKASIQTQACSNVAVSGLTKTSTYTVSVVAVDSTQRYEDSEPAAASFATIDVKKLVKPSGLTTSRTDNSITISWKAVSNAAKYYVQYKPSTASSYTSLYTTSTSVTIAGLKSGTTYNVRIKATPSDTADYANSDYTSTTIAASALNTSGLDDDLDLAFAELGQDEFWNDDLFAEELV